MTNCGFMSTRAKPGTSTAIEAAGEVVRHLTKPVLQSDDPLHLRELELRKEGDDGKAALVIDIGGGQAAAAEALPYGIASILDPPGVGHEVES